MGIFLMVSANAQTKYFTKTGTISFYSKSAMENIEATNNKVVSIWDVTTGQIEVAVLMKGFEFEKALMQEHFNENYIESDKYPKGTFKGIIENGKAISLTTDNTVSVKVSGSLTLHGVTNPVNTTAVISIKNGVISATSKFTVAPADYKISIPSLVADKINKNITIAVFIPAFQPLAPK
jgi:polyisoprenoid-binding protein YceI